MTTHRNHTKPARPRCHTAGRVGGQRSLTVMDPFMTASHMREVSRTVLDPGATLGRFVVRERIGSGGQWDVYLAHDMITDMEVAIKFIDLGADDKSAADLLRHEKLAADGVQDHRHVINVHDLHEVKHGGTQFLVLSAEYGDGGTLERWLTVAREDVVRRRECAPEFLRQMGLGVAALHKAGIFLLDLKPSNMLFVRGTLKIADLGGAVDAVRSTAGWGGMGTPAYMSPARRSFGPWGASEDIYSLGAIFYEMISPACRPPFAEMTSRRQTSGAQTVGSVLQDLPAGQAEILSRCLADDPRERYPSIEDLLSAIEGCRSRDPEADGRRQAKVDELWQDACEQVGYGQFDQAGAKCQEVLALAPSHVQALAMLREIQQRCERAGTIYSTIEKGLPTEGVDSLVLLLQEAVSTYPNHPAGTAVQIKLQVKKGQYQHAMQAGVAAVRQSDWENARCWFALGKQLNPGGTVVEGAFGVTEVVMAYAQRMRCLIDRAIAASDRQQAISLAGHLDDYLASMARRTLPERGHAR